MDTMRICPGCKKPLAANAPEGLCPECLLKAGLGTGVDPGPDTQSAGGRITFVVPTLEELAKCFPQLEILSLIGQGGMGAVYRARQKQLGRIVALKILPPGIGSDPAFAERFAREARALARLNHPGVVTLYEFGQADGLFFFLMEFVDGVNLRQLLESGRLSPREALAIVPQICDALQYAHDQGIVHRDIKPENVLLDRQGRVKVADFGLAKLVGAQATGEPPARPPTSSLGALEDKADTFPPSDAGRAGVRGEPVLTDAGKVMGTPVYMAPEQRHRPTEVDHRADIYSLGVVFYQMLTGELPGATIQPPSKSVRIDVRLDNVVLRALEEEPRRRYQHASEVKADVETIAGTPATGTVTSAESPAAAESGLKATRGPGGGQLSRKAVLGAVWAPFFIFPLLVLFVHRVALDGAPPRPEWWQTLLMALSLPLGMAAPFGTTILGAISISEIRRSAGRLYGLGLALFDTLCFPLLALDVLIVWLSFLVIHAVAKGTAVDSTSLITGFAIWVCIAVDAWIAIRAWGAATKPAVAPPADADAGAPVPPDRAERVHRRLRLPGAGLLLTGLVNLILLGSIYGSGWWPKIIGTATLDTDMFRLSESESYRYYLLLLASVAVVAGAWSLLRAKSYVTATVGVVAGCALPFGGGNLACLPFAVWSLLLLVRPEVRQIFAAHPRRMGSRAVAGWAWAAVLLVMPASLFTWFILVGHRWFGLDIDATEQFFATLVGFPVNAATGALLGWLILVGRSGSPAASATAITPRSWSWLALAAGILLVVSWPLGGAAIVILHLLSQDPSWNPGVGEAFWTIAILGGAGLTALACTAFGFVALRPIRAAAGALRGRLPAMASAWFWPCLTVAALTFVAMPGLQIRQFAQKQELPAMSQIEQAKGVAASEAAAAAQRFTFGPVMERTLYDPDEDLQNILLDLDSGRMMDCPVPWPSSSAPRTEWQTALEGLIAAARREGMDVCSDASGAAFQTFGLAMVQLGANDFEQITTATAQAYDQLAGRDFQDETLGITNAPATFWFRTKAGSTGLLQITPFATETPRAVKLRYKLVQPPLLAETSNGAALAFGPVTEQVIGLRSDDVTACLDLDRGVLRPLPLKSLSRELDRGRLRALGADLFAWQRKVHGLDLFVITWDANAWNLPAHEVVPRLTHNGDWPPRDELELRAGPITYAFRNREGTIGLLQLEEVPTDPNRVTVRYKLIQSEVPTVASTTVAPALGPVIERVLPCSDPCRMHYLQFVTGRVITIGEGPGDTSDHAEDYRRAEESGGIDATVGGGEEGVQFVGEGCVFARVQSPRWETMTAEEVLRTLRRESWLYGVVEIEAREFPATYLFKTARGACGILQILGVPEESADGNERGVRLRYKLVQPTRSEGAQQPTPGEPADLRQAKARLAELQAIYAEEHPEVRRAASRVEELERLGREEPSASAELRTAKARLAELRMSFGEQHPEVQAAIARVRALESK